MKNKNKSNSLDKMPVKYRNILIGIANCEEKYSKEQALQYLIVHKFDYLKKDNSLDGCIFMAMVEELFGNILTAPLWKDDDSIWKYENEIGDILVNGVQKYIDYYESTNKLSKLHRTEIGRRDFYDLITLCQNMHLSLYYYYYHQRSTEKANAELKQILLATKNNTEYMLNNEMVNELFLMESEGIDHFFLRGFERYSEPLSSVYHETLEEPFHIDIKNIIEEYVEFLSEMDQKLNNYQSKELKNRWLFRLANLYDCYLEDTNDEISNVEEELVELCKKRKDITKKLFSIKSLIPEYERKRSKDLPF